VTDTNEHAALEARRHMLAIADAWPDLEDRLGREGSTVGDKVSGTKTPGLVINEHVSDVMGEVREWVTFLARALIDETDWTPPAGGTPELLHDIATNRIGHFTEHPDEGLRLAFHDDAREMHRKVMGAAYPRGIRTIRLGIPCDEHTTSDLGERVPCPGQYETRLDPEESIGDLVCSTDPEHRMTPLEWQRSQRRRDVARDRDLDALLAGSRKRHTSERMGA